MVASYYRVPNKLLEVIIAHPDDIEELVFNSEQVQETEFDIDKSWHGIYFLLTGENDIDAPISTFVGQALLGGKEIGNELGYGPLRYHEPSGVNKLYNELKNISLSELSDKYDINNFNENEIYPLNGEWTIEDKAYLLEHYEGLLNYYKTAVEEQEAMLLLLG